jgi:hypothetical protein
VLVALALPATAHSSTDHVITASKLVADLGSRAVTLADYRVVGAVRLKRRPVDHELICVRCTFSDHLSASGTTFAKIVDLGGSTFRRLRDGRRRQQP